MKKIILITMLMSAVFAQSDCNKNNWRDYYNSDGKDMSDCELRLANLTDADLINAYLTNAELSFANLRGANLTDADLTYAILTGANLTGAILEGVESDNIGGLPLSLPDGWSLVDGTLVEDEETEELTNRELSDEIFRQINEGNAIKKSKWIAWKNENDPQVSKGKTTFKNLDKNNNGKISSGEFFKFYKRWIQD